MVGRNRDIKVTFLGSDRQLRQTFDSVERGAGGVARGFGGVSTAVKGVLALGAVALFTDMANAAAEDAKSQDVLAVSMRNTLGATREQVGATETWITAMQRATHVADTDLRQALGNLLLAGRNEAEARREVALVTDVAAAKGLDLTAVTNGFIKAANGNVGALGRLGVQTKDAAGEALSYDEILQNLADTMGGTAAESAAGLGGSLEGLKVQLEETKERAGVPLLRPLIRIGEAVDEFFNTLEGGTPQLSRINAEFQRLVRSGIDPTANRSAALATIVGITANSYRDLEGVIQQGIVLTGASNDELLEARQRLIEYGESLGLNEEQIRQVVLEIDHYIEMMDELEGQSNDTTRSQEELAQAVRDNIAAQREATDPVFRFISALQRYETAQETLNRLTTEGKTDSDEYRGAITDLLRSVQDYNGAQAELVAGGEEGLEILEGYAAQAGINEHTFARWRNEIGLLASAIAGLPSQITTTRGTFATITSGTRGEKGFAGGGTVGGTGPIGSPQLVIAHKGERFLGTGDDETRSITLMMPLYIAGVKFEDVIVKITEDAIRKGRLPRAS